MIVTTLDQVILMRENYVGTLAESNSARNSVDLNLDELESIISLNSQVSCIGFMPILTVAIAYILTLLLKWMHSNRWNQLGVLLFLISCDANIGLQIQQSSVQVSVPNTIFIILKCGTG